MTAAYGPVRQEYLSQLLSRLAGQWEDEERDKHTGQYRDYVYERRGWYTRTREYDNYGNLQTVSVEFTEYYDQRGLG